MYEVVRFVTLRVNSQLWVCHKVGFVYVGWRLLGVTITLRVNVMCDVDESATVGVKQNVKYR